MIPRGALYAVDASGRPRRFGMLAGDNVVVLDEPEKLRRLARNAAECVDDLATLLSGVDDASRQRLGEMLSTLVQAPDSERTKSAIRDLLTPKAATAPD